MIVDVDAQREGELPQRGINPAVERLHDDMRQQLQESKLAELDIEGEYQDCFTNYGKIIIWYSYL